ncbi:MAG: trypsin-like peptidase domain-containing protein [Acidobacteriota bacterium]
MTTSMRLRTLLLTVSLALLGGFLAGQALPPALLPVTAAQDATAEGSVGTPPPIPSDLSPEETRDIGVFRRASGSVVYITRSEMVRRGYFEVAEMPTGTGSGFVWDRDGHIVTNYHVVQEGRSQRGPSFSVTLSDKSTWDARVIGIAPEKDLAVLKIDAPPDKLTPLATGSSADLVVGQRVLAVGNPFGLDHTLTVGVVSALGREIQSPTGRTIHDVVQTDAAINPGNSGGPLLDSRGRLIGINSMIYSPSGASSGVGFAIPVDTVKRLVPQLIKNGRATQVGIGVSLLNDGLVQQWGIQGAVIYEVATGMPAEQAGLEGVTEGRGGRITLGDRIVAVDGKPVRTANDLADAFEAKGAGAPVSLTIQRHNERREVNLKLVTLD